ncbi:GDSL esterase/lipase At2g30310-like [Cryptomeria japonica]|uniref:GDSL esterase/lipase At2g30310-like n=1 Tax=Cryptomeria japonica TaxID=3369 RepID=UPI0027DA9097|nr:GDSL esterase/lipase At2g30310-like [Cryptomeria japonica]
MGRLNHVGCICLVLCILLSISSGIETIKGKAKIPAFFTFGDSLVDPGNNNFINTIAKANHAPYGQDFRGHEQNGRFSNGKLATDFIASRLGVKENIPPFLDPNLNSQELLTGVSFASAGTGFDNLTSTRFEIYKLGVRKLGVAGHPPLGCIPIEKTLQGESMLNGCIQAINYISSSYNQKLKEALQGLKARLPGIRLEYVDIYDNMLDMIKHPLLYGFEISNRGCCGTGLLEVGPRCDNRTPITCSNTSKSVFWDSAHPTQATYQIIADKLLLQNIPKLL